MRKFIIAIIVAITSMSSFADVKYIGVNNASVREYANHSSPVIDNLPKGKAVTVYDTLDGWSRLTDVKETNQRWVNSNDLCNTKGCNLGNKTVAHNVKPVLKTKQLKSTKTHRKPKVIQAKPKKNKTRSVYSSSCSCGYGYCYGPRGGRYCITSSGNKSYR